MGSSWAREAKLIWEIAHQRAGRYRGFRRADGLFRGASGFVVGWTKNRKGAARYIQSNYNPPPPQALPMLKGVQNPFVRQHMGFIMATETLQKMILEIPLSSDHSSRMLRGQRVLPCGHWGL